MKKLRLFLLMLSAAVLPFTACQTGNESTDGNGDGSTPDPVTPTVTLALVEGSVTATSFLATVSTTDAEQAAWVTRGHGEAAPEAAVVFDEGIALSLPQGGPATLTVEDLNPETEYDLYVAVSNGDTKVLSEPLCVTTNAAEVVPPTPAVPVVELYGYEMMTEYMQSIDLWTTMGKPGIFTVLSCQGYDDEKGELYLAGNMSLVMLDYDCDNYLYLTSHHYPLREGNIDENQFPTESCVMVCSYTSFMVGDKEYYPVVPETDTDANGNAYGVTMYMTPEMTGKDMSFFEYYIPAEDEDGNQVILQGSYTGPMGYVIGATQQTVPLDLNTWRLTSFKGSISDNTLTLQSVGGGTVLTFNLWLGEDGSKEWANADGVTWEAEFDELGQPMGALTGYFEDPDFNVCKLTKGKFVLKTTETEGEYLLVMSRNTLTFESDSMVYELSTPNNDEQAYAVTITME